MNGVMDEIRDRLAAGKSSGEIIALGYRPGSVYKAQRQLTGTPQRGAAAVAQEPPAEGGQPEPAAGEEADGGAVVESLTDELAEARSRIEELEAANKELGQRVAALEASAPDAASLRRQVGELAATWRRVQAQLPPLQGAAREWEEFHRAQKLSQLCQRLAARAKGPGQM